MQDWTYTLNKIRKQKLITEYLASKGIHPERESGNRLMYICPLHQDTAPSFVVYLPTTSEGYQQYYCFGCKSCKCIIQLYAKLEEVSWKHAVADLGKDLNITSADALDFLVESLKREMETEEIENLSAELGSLSLNISVIGFDYLRNVKYDVVELEFLDVFYKYVDSLVVNCDIHGLQKAYDFISDRKVEYKGDRFTPFAYKRRLWEENNMLDILECEKAYNNVG